MGFCSIFLLAETGIALQEELNNHKCNHTWKSDGTTNGTVQLKDINPGGHNIYLFRHFVNANGTLLFSFYDDENGYELWKSTGTTAGTTIVRDINPGIYGSQVTNITYFGKNISFFEAYDGKKRQTANASPLGTP